MHSLEIFVDRSLGIPLIQQIYDQVRTAIVRGDLHAGEALPSTRQLAADLGVARIVAVEAYDQLVSEGYLESRPRSGMRVAGGASLAAEQKAPVPPSPAAIKTPGLIDFRSGVPALELFPQKTWGRLYQQICAAAPAGMFGRSQPEGCLELRSELARYLAKTRRVRCHPDQVIVTSGATQAIFLIARLLLDGGKEVALEDPITDDIQAIFSAAGAGLYPIATDEFGLQTGLLPADRTFGLVFVTPSHQFPLGSVLPIQRRVQLIEYARQNACYIAEDDYDSEFRYLGTPVSSLQELEPERVIYIGTLSKTLSPALRLGYIVLPYPLVEPCRNIKRLTDQHVPLLDQYVLTRFIQEGFLERHIARMKKVYRKRRDCLIAALTAAFPDRVHISGETTGMHLIAAFDDIVFDEKTIRGLEESGVRLYPVENHANRKGLHTHQVILGYGNLQPQEIETGVKNLKQFFL